MSPPPLLNRIGLAAQILYLIHRIYRGFPRITVRLVAFGPFAWQVDAPSCFALERPSCTRLASNQRCGFWARHALHRLCVPVDFFAKPIGDVAEVVCLGQWSRITEGATGLAFATACRQPFFVMSGGNREEWFRRLKVGEFLFRKQHVLAIVGQQHTLGSHEQYTAAPLGNFAAFPAIWFVAALIPRQLDGG